MEAIQKLNKTTKEMFMDIFAKIRLNLKIFQDTLCGGDAQLCF